MNQSIGTLFCIAIFCCSQLSFAQDIAEHVPNNNFSYPGGVALLKLPKTSNSLPSVRYGLKEPAILDQGSHWLVLLGIGLDQLPGEYVVYTRQTGESESAQFKKFEVIHKNYPLESSESAQRKDIAKIDALSELDFSNTQPPKLPMQLPFEAQWDEQFGKLTVSNKDADSLVQNHSSARAATNTLVKAPQQGIISNIIDAPKGAIGNTKVLVIDHGRGIYSLLHGVTDLAVEIGNHVVTGAVVAKVPAPGGTRSGAGRASVTGISPKQRLNRDNRNANTDMARVFWQVQLNDVLVNPLILTKLQ